MCLYGKSSPEEVIYLSSPNFKDFWAHFMKDLVYLKGTQKGQRINLRLVHKKCFSMAGQFHIFYARYHHLPVLYVTLGWSYDFLGNCWLFHAIISHKITFYDGQLTLDFITCLQLRHSCALVFFLLLLQWLLSSSTFDHPFIVATELLRTKVRPCIRKAIRVLGLFLRISTAES